MKRTDILFVVALVFMVVATTIGDVTSEAKQVRENTLRLHMLANSDSKHDQNLKLELRDELLRKYSTQLATSDGIQQAIYNTREKLDEISSFLTQQSQQRGFNYNVTANIVTMHFDTRMYSDDITMPAGVYNALRITIGEGNGRNWWCVMYPPLCIPVASEGDAKLVEKKIECLNSDTIIIPKFAIVEFVNLLNKN